MSSDALFELQARAGSGQADERLRGRRGRLRAVAWHRLSRDRRGRPREKCDWNENKKMHVGMNYARRQDEWEGYIAVPTSDAREMMECVLE